MNPISTQSLLEALNWRYATKKFDSSAKIPQDQWAALEQSLLLAPSSFGLQPWQFLVVKDRALLQELVGATWGQTQVVDCSHFVVFLGRKGVDEAEVQRYLERTVALRGGTVEGLKGYRDVIVASLDKARAGGYLDVWQSRQVYIALGELMTAAALLGIDSCPLEGLDPAAYDRILGIDTSKWGTLCACALGYRSGDDKYATAPKVRYAQSEVIVTR